MLRAEFKLPSITSEEAAPERKAPIRVKFEIPYFTVSGIQVSSELKWVVFKDFCFTSFIILMLWLIFFVNNNYCAFVFPCKTANS